MARTSGDGRRWLLVVLAAILTLSVVAPVVGVASTNGNGDVVHQQDSEPNSTTVQSPDYTYEELSTTAAHPQGAPPSVRPSGSYAEYAIKYLPTGLFYIEGFERYAARGTEIKRTSFEFWSKRPYQTADNPVPDKTVTVHTVLWKTKQVTVTEGNQTRQETVAVNVTDMKHEVTLGPGYTVKELPLPKEFDSTKRLTVFVEGEENTARWQYTYAPSTVARTVPARSEGTQTLYIAALFGIATLFAGVSLKGSRRLLERAGAGPQISLLVWGLLVVPGAFVLFFILGWDWTIQQLITAPWLFPVLLGCIVGFMASVWFGDYTFTDLFIRLKIDDNIPESVPTDTPRERSQAPEGPDVVDVEARDITRADGGQVTGTPRRMQAVIDSFRHSADSTTSQRQDGRSRTPGSTSEIALGDIPGVISADVIPMKMTRHQDGSVGPIGKGLSAFAARAKSAMTRLRTDGNPHNRIEVDKGPYNSIYMVDPEFDPVIEHESESWTWDFPELLTQVTDEEGNSHWSANWKAIVGGPMALGLGWVFGDLLLNNPPLGAAITAMGLVWRYVLEPSRGHAYTELAPIHYDRVVEVVMSHASALAEVTSLEDSWTGWVRSETEKRVERRRLADQKSKTQSESINDEFLASESDGEEDFNADGRSRSGRGGGR